MRIGVPAESKPGETRVAATPKTVEQLLALGYDVAVEQGAGAQSAFSDEAYAAAGASVVAGPDAWRSDIVLKVNPPSDDEIALLQAGTMIACLISPAINPGLVERLTAAGVTALAMDAVPRISRAQSLDVLSSMANIGGYRAVIEAANEYGATFGGQVTAAGKVAPANVLVVGAGVAGLAAIGTAGSLGSVVRAFDARPEVAEQVESMGAQFLRIEGLEDEGPSATGYAKEMGEDFNRKAAELYAEQTKVADIVITTALIPGKPAPRLITEEMVASMKPGSVVVDMAAANGGNVAGSLPDERVVTPNGVIILGYTDLPGRLPTQASQLYSTNLVNLMKLLTPGKDGRVVLDLEDPVQRGMTVCRDGETLWPPPPVAVSAAPAPAASGAAADSAPTGAPEKPEKKPRDPRVKYAVMAVAALLFAFVAANSPAVFLGHFTVFALAVIVGFYVISNVAHALHTPLMSETNAISGIILVGAILQVGSSNTVVQVIAFVGIVIASINIFGGFAVTGRMLQMFRKD
ncbi:Re/Si-specific NAD(P)(+) transhydrogenase subunit alpha [Knoellia koreensis]|uniref:NAD(P) transhydrogenase subunit alpha n=1 Tax=Knoellia koreensis TaxID=2730921 RepID=A0A849HJ12_9MICO|nr:Re/Si-specific NAD(P)(+) transhydrogenase subunit alpha [Knoellia sp. DB2414S]